MCVDIRVDNIWVVCGVFLSFDHDCADLTCSVSGVVMCDVGDSVKWLGIWGWNTCKDCARSLSFLMAVTKLERNIGCIC